MKLCLALLLIPAYGYAIDAAGADPESHRVVLENPYVRVLESRVPAGHRVPLHAHPDRAVVVLASYLARVTLADGKVEVVDRKAGDVFWANATEHSMEVLAGTVHEIETEIKPAVPAKPSQSARDVTEVTPQVSRILFENDRVRLVDLRGEPGQDFPLHSHPDRVSVRLGSARSKVTRLDGSIQVVDFRPGDASWSPADEHADMVLSGSFHNVMIEIKGR